MNVPSFGPSVEFLTALTGTAPTLVLTAASTDSGETSPVWVDPPRAADLAIARVGFRDLIDGTDALRRVIDQHLGSGVQALLLAPPLGRPRDRPGRLDLSELAAKAVLEALPAEVRFVPCLLSSALGRPKGPSILDQLVAHRHPSAVIEISGADLMPGVHRSLRLCAVRLDSVPPDQVVFYSTFLQGAPAGPHAVGELSELLDGADRTDHGFVVRFDSLDLKGGLLPGQVDPARRQRIADLADLGDTRSLSEICEILTSPQTIRQESHDPGSNRVRAVTGRMVSDGDLLMEEDDHMQWVEPEKALLLHPGDLLLRRLQHSAAPVQAAEVGPEVLPLALGSNMIALRPGPTLNAQKRRFLKLFLGSRRFDDQLPSRLTGSMQLRRSELGQVRVPIPDQDLLRAVQSLSLASAALRAWSDEADELLAAVIDEADLGEARRRALAQGNLLRQRADAASMLDDLGHRVATRFPLPVAYRWRSAMAARGGPDELTGILHAQEVLLAYVAILGLVLARESDIEVGHLRDVGGRLSRFRGGITLGDWRAILLEASQARAFRRLPEASPFLEVRDFLGNEEVMDASTRLQDVRNDRSHLREFGPGERAERLAQCWSDLEVMFEEAEFLTDYPLVRVLSTQWDSLQERNQVSFLRLTGDHAVVPRRQLSTSSSAIEADSLYLQDRAGDLHLLRPFLIGKECPSCGHWSTFHPERMADAGTAVYKSLEHGHTTDESGPAPALLERVGLLGTDRQV